ncbi:MAG TPA: type II secretion system secretin GspD [Moraxellaceae bacterium]|nr:type II secretion system secretin GspD [Moraxellaceae bacterium]
MAVSKSSAALLLALALSLPAHAAKPKTWKVNLKDADINALVSEVAEVTGKNFVVDPRVKGTITVISSKALSADELYELFLGVLSVNGFAAVPSGGAIKIVPDVTAKQFGVPVDVNLSRKGEALVTRVIRLENTNAVDMVPILRPMMPQFAHLAAVAGANALVLSDHANNIESLTQIIAQLDGTTGDEIEVVPLRDARVDDVVSMLESLTGGGGAPGNKEARQLYRVRVVADARANRLLLKGDPHGRKRLRELISTLDMPSERLGGVRVFRLRHASAKQVAEVLRGLVAGESGRSVGSSSGSSLGSSSSGGAAAGGGAGGGAGTTSSAPVTLNANGVGLIADESLNALVVRADPAFMREIINVIDQLDQRRSQVLIQAAIVEVSGDNARQLGVQWAAGDPSKGVGLINFSAAGSTLSSLATAAVANDPTLATISEGATLGIGKSETNANGDRTFYGALIQALSSVTNANLLSTPSIMTLDNQEAKIVVGQNVPFITGTSTSSSSTTSNPFQTIERQDVGITLKVVPHIGEGGTVRLEIEQEVSAVLPSTSGIKSADLITSKRSIKTTVLADDGQTIVLGGLIRDDVTKSVSKVPLLGDIPLLGYLFRASSTNKTKQNLLVFLQPTLLRDSASAAEMSQYQYEAIRTLDMSVSRSGKVTRLPARVEQIYQGYQARPAAPASQTTPQAPVEEAPPQGAQPSQATPAAPAQP